MTHERDDAVSPQAIGDAASIVVRRQLSEGRPVADIAREVVTERFCTSAAETGPIDNVSFQENLVRDVAERAEGMLAARHLLNRIDRASQDSFPASDPPAWINSGPPRP